MTGYALRRDEASGEKRKRERVGSRKKAKGKGKRGERDADERGKGRKSAEHTAILNGLTIP